MGVSARFLLIAGALLANVALGQQPPDAPAPLRLLCKGEQESGLVGDTNRKREQRTIQLTVNLATGSFDAEGLTIITRPAATRPPSFKVSEAELYFYEEQSRENVVTLSKITVDRYSGLLRETQVISVTQSAHMPMTITGEYRCTRLEKPVF